MSEGLARRQPGSSERGSGAPRKGPPRKGPPRKGQPPELHLVHLSTLLVGGTGLVYAWMRYFAESADPFAIVNHPWQPTLQHLHIWFAPLLVWSVGLIWREHVWKRWKDGVEVRRRSGLILMANLVPMVVSGTLIQTAVTASWRNLWVGIHLASSGLWILSHLLHLILPRLARIRPALPAARP